MFDHLTDPSPPPLGDSFRVRVVARARGRQRRARVVTGALAISPLVAAGGLAVYVRNQANELEHIDIGGLVPAASLPPVTSGGAVGDVDTVTDPAPPIDRPLTILVVGVDSHGPVDDGSGVVSGRRGDTIVIVRLDPITSQIRMLQVPRDMWIGERSDGARINSFTEDGRLVEVVSKTFGLEINHYIEIDFAGFRSLVDLAGGVTIPFDQPVRDQHTGFSTDAGCQTLTGNEALAYVRSRYMETLDPVTGKWTPDPRSDFGRIERQQDAIRRVLGQVLTADYGTAGELDLLTDVVDDLTTDSGLTVTGLRAIFNAARAIGPDRVFSDDLTAVMRSDVIQGNSVLVADPADIATVVERFLITEASAGGHPVLADHPDAIRPSESLAC